MMRAASLIRSGLSALGITPLLQGVIVAGVLALGLGLAAAKVKGAWDARWQAGYAAAEAACEVAALQTANANLRRNLAAVRASQTLDRQRLAEIAAEKSRLEKENRTYVQALRMRPAAAACRADDADVAHDRRLRERGPDPASARDQR